MGLVSRAVMRRTSTRNAIRLPVTVLGHVQDHGYIWQWLRGNIANAFGWRLWWG
jgi:hypothetical protein